MNWERGDFFARNFPMAFFDPLRIRLFFHIDFAIHSMEIPFHRRPSIHFFGFRETWEEPGPKPQPKRANTHDHSPFLWLGVQGPTAGRKIDSGIYKHKTPNQIHLKPL